ncbi:12097_t:CDS:2 [Ambispora gerdemannii]|uniref:12097_t:CDS:1 n=1 Tax=Ambispora gerdemannii TaxID=144530 RepID=A0A9N8WEV4_9GLOM|nr:12097_t:CDS:2 [Ambispora gerdemannii]
MSVIILEGGIKEWPTFKEFYKQHDLFEYKLQLEIVQTRTDRGREKSEDHRLHNILAENLILRRFDGIRR